MRDPERLYSLKQQDFIFASSHILCETLPPDYDTWSDEKLEDFLSENAYEPYEHFTPRQLYQEIESLARSIRGYIIADQGGDTLLFGDTP